MKIYTKFCPTCKKNFQTKFNHQRNCSLNCSVKSRYVDERTVYDIPKGMQQCSKCRQVLPLDAFHRSETGFQGLRHACKFCSGIYNLARKTKIPYQKIIELIENQQWKCAICGESMHYFYEHPEDTCRTDRSVSISADHIDPKKGNELNNLQFTHWICNVMKQDKTMEELIQWCKLVLNHKNAVS